MYPLPPVLGDAVSTRMRVGAMERRAPVVLMVVVMLLGSVPVAHGELPLPRVPVQYEERFRST
jgi:hypothetical protein